MQDYSKERIAAIRMAISLGRIFQQEIPGIVDDYRHGMNARDIVAKYNLVSRYDIASSEIAAKGVNYALGGNHSDTYGTEEYHGLIRSAQERRMLAQRHNRRNGSRNGRLLFMEGRGIHAQTPEEKRNVGLEAAISRDETPWIERGPDEAENLPEIVYAEILTHLPQYQNKDGRYNSVLVTRALNHVYHCGKRIRTGHAIHIGLSRLRKRLRGKRPA